MLATMNISQSTASIHQNGHLDIQRDHGEHIDFDKICPGCKLSAVSDDGGLVVAFGYVSTFSLSRFPFYSVPAFFLLC